MQIPHFLRFETKKGQIIAKESRHLLILRSKQNETKFNEYNCAINRKNFESAAQLKRNKF